MPEQSWVPIWRPNNRPDEAESCYTRGLTVLDFKDKAARTTVSLRELATVLSNLGELRRAAGRPGAEDSLRRSISICEELAARKSAARADRQTLAIAQNNLAEVLVAAGRVEEAGSLFAKSITGLDRLAREFTKAVDTQNYLGYVYEQQAQLLAKIGQLPKARQSIEAAVEHQRQAVKLTDGKVAAYRMHARRPPRVSLKNMPQAASVRRCDSRGDRRVQGRSGLRRRVL